MNKQVRELAKQAGGNFSTYCLLSNPPQYRESIELWDDKIEKFVELIKQSIYDKVKEELIPDEVIAEEFFSNAEEQVRHQEYLKGCNAGIVDALCYIKQFGVEE
jgi:hypothetical protein